jgi:hypothetical protein
MITGDVIDDFDIVLTDMLLPLGPAFIHDLSAMYDAYRTGGSFNILAGQYWASLSSYVVNTKAAGKLIRLLRDEVKAGMRLPVDLCIGKLVASGAVTVGCLFPFVTSIRRSEILETTIPAPGTRRRSG